MKRLSLLVFALIAGCTAASTPRAPAPRASGPPVTLVTIGGDETFGADLPRDERFRVSWPQLVYRSLPSRATFTNLGTPGATSVSSLATQARIVRELHPTIVVVWLPGDAAAADLVSLLQQVRPSPSVKLVVVVGPHVPGNASDEATTTMAAQEAGAHLVDLTSLPAPLGASGHRAAADAITAAIGPVN